MTPVSQNQSPDRATAWDRLRVLMRDVLLASLIAGLLTACAAGIQADDNPGTDLTASLAPSDTAVTTTAAEPSSAVTDEPVPTPDPDPGPGTGAENDPVEDPSDNPSESSDPEGEPPSLPDRSSAYIYEANPKLTPVNYDSPALLPPTADMGQVYMDRITFICDSPTYWMWPKGLLGGGKASKQIWTGPEGTMTLAYQSSYWILDPYDRQEKPIREVVRLHKPEYIIIALGINGISFMDEAYFTAEYTDLVTDIQEISPRTTLILQSIYPITRRYKHWGSITNASITRGNSWILKIAEETGCKYLDTISVLLNDEGNAKDELMMKDGLHPNVDGLRVIIDYIRTHGYIPEIMPDFRHIRRRPLQ